MRLVNALRARIGSSVSMLMSLGLGLVCMQVLVFS